VFRNSLIPVAFLSSEKQVPSVSDIICARMTAEPGQELSILAEKLKALQTLMRYERDIEKLQFYKRELEAVVNELRELEIASRAKKPAKVLPFPPKKPSRSA
jgi:hypothetical protein